MIYAEVSFYSNDIEDIHIILPYPPRIGENIEFPYGTIKWNNGAPLEDRNFRIKDIDWVVKEDSTLLSKYKFEKLIIYVERP